MLLIVTLGASLSGKSGLFVKAYTTPNTAGSLFVTNRKFLLRDG